MTITNIINEARSFFLKNDFFHQKKMPQEIFKQNLIDFSNRKIGKEECIKICCEYVCHLCPFTEKKLLDTHKPVIEEQIANFNRSVELALQLSNQETKELKNMFSTVLADFVLEGWSCAMAKSFYSVFTKSEQVVEVDEVVEWTKRFLQDVEYLCSLQGVPFGPCPVDEMRTKISNALAEHSDEIAQKKIASFVLQAEKQPFFLSMGKETIPLGLLNHFSLYSKANAMKELLNRCVQTVYNCHQKNIEDSMIIGQYLILELKRKTSKL